MHSIFWSLLNTYIKTLAHFCLFWPPICSSCPSYSISSPPGPTLELSREGNFFKLKNSGKNEKMKKSFCSFTQLKGISVRLVGFIGLLDVHIASKLKFQVRICNNCIELFDHHCTFIGNCIGRLNYKYFISFLLSTVLLFVSECVGFLIYLFQVIGSSSGTINPLCKKSFNFPLVIRNSIFLVLILIFILIPTVLITLFVILLCSFHGYLIIK